MKDKFIKTHQIEFKRELDLTWKHQPACGKTDLFNCLREMMKDGFTQFKITTLKKQ